MVSFPLFLHLSSFSFIFTVFLLSLLHHDSFISSSYFNHLLSLIPPACSYLYTVKILSLRSIILYPLSPFPLLSFLAASAGSTNTLPFYSSAHVATTQQVAISLEGTERSWVSAKPSMESEGNYFRSNFWWIWTLIWAIGLLCYYFSRVTAAKEQKQRRRRSRKNPSISRRCAAVAWEIFCWSVETADWILQQLDHDGDW